MTVLILLARPPLKKQLEFLPPQNRLCFRLCLLVGWLFGWKTMNYCVICQSSSGSILGNLMTLVVTGF